MKNFIKKITVSLSALALSCCLVLSSGLSDAVYAESLAQTEGESSYILLQEIIDLYLETSLYETDRETLINDMLYNYLMSNPHMFAALANAMLSANDPYSAYYKANSGFLEPTGKSFGIVVADSESFDDDDPRKKTGGVYITEVLSESNAEFAGILPGDRFISLEGLNVEGLSVSGIKHLINYMPFKDKDPSLSEVYEKFTDIDPNSEEYAGFVKLNWNPAREIDMVFERTYSDGSKGFVKFSVPKGTVHNKDVFLDINKEKGVASIQISAFDVEDVTEQFKKAFDEAKASGCTKLIIDLRDNPGGYFEAAIALGSLFTKGTQTMFYTKSRGDEELNPVMSDGTYIGDSFEKYTVLINENTASAAELFAYILQSQQGATLIGEKSFGKAVGQNVYNVINGDSFTITNFEIYRADKTSYNLVGLVPDITVPAVPRKYEFPTGLSHFNHENYVEITDGAENGPTLALEQRFGILGLLRSDAIDGVCDDSTRAAVMIYKRVVMNDKEPDGNVSFDMVTYLTASINAYKDRYLYIDSQYDVALLFLENESRGKRLAKEYITENNKYEQMREAEREAAEKEYEEQREAERESEMTDDESDVEEAELIPENAG